MHRFLCALNTWFLLDVFARDEQSLCAELHGAFGFGWFLRNFVGHFSNQSHSFYSTEDYLSGDGRFVAGD